MKILRKYLDKKNKGYYSLQPESDEDLWFLYNIIKPGDNIKLKVKRKLQDQTFTGLTKTERRFVFAKLEVLSVDFDYDSKGTSISCKTRNLEGSDFIEKGQIQNIEIPLYYPINVSKAHWDEITLGFIEESLQVNEKSDIGVLLMEDGRANAYYMKSNYSLWQGKVEKTMPRKKNSLMEFYKKAYDAFQARCLSLIDNIFDLDTVKCFVIAGPGTSAKNFLTFLQKVKEKQEFSKLKRNFSKFIVVPASSSQISALTEIMEDSTVQKLIMDTRAMRETQILKQFLDTIYTCSNKVRADSPGGLRRKRGAARARKPRDRTPADHRRALPCTRLQDAQEIHQAGRRGEGAGRAGAHILGPAPERPEAEGDHG